MDDGYEPGGGAPVSLCFGFRLLQLGRQLGGQLLGRHICEQLESTRSGIAAASHAHAWRWGSSCLPPSPGVPVHAPALLYLYAGE